MSTTIQIKRGLAVNLPGTGAAGEPIFTTDDQRLHFGTGASVVPLTVAAADVVGLINGGTEPVNAQTGTAYTILSGDFGKLVTLSNAAAVAVTVPSGVFSTDQFVDFQNKGVGDVTITPTTATINGGASFVLHTGQGIRVVFDGTDFQVILGRAVVAKSGITSEWLRSVGTDGVFTSSQPNFTDISGVLDGGSF